MTYASYAIVDNQLKAAIKVCDITDYMGIVPIRLPKLLEKLIKLSYKYPGIIEMQVKLKVCIVYYLEDI